LQCASRSWPPTFSPWCTWRPSLCGWHAKRGIETTARK
jgi:hypothetical protein